MNSKNNLAQHCQTQAESKFNWAKKAGILITTSMMFAANLQAAGFQVAEHSASGLGRAFSGEGAVADNAAVLARNPAAITLFDQAQVSSVLSLVNPEVDVYDRSNNEHADDIAPFQAVPAAYYISPIDDKWSWGIGMFTNYGVATDYPDDLSAGDIAGDTSLESVNINPNLAFKVSDAVSLAVGANITVAKAELTRHKGALAPTFGPGEKSDKLIGMTGTTVGYGWNIGALYQTDSNSRFGFAYRSKVTLDFDEGEFSSYDSDIAPSAKVDGRLVIDLPAIIELSAFHQLNDRWAIHYGWQQTDWSSFTELKGTSAQCNSKAGAGICFLKEEHYEDSNRYSFGATYNLNSQWTLRSGIAYDEQAGKATLSIPDSDRYWYSAGLSYQYSPELSFDAAVTLIESKSGTFTETNAAPQTFEFESEGSAYIGAIQINYILK